MPNLEISNFSKGWASDNELDPDKLYSFLTFINSDIDFERGSSVRRPGYNRHHALLPAVPKQFYEFVDLSGYHQNELTISNGKLYWYSATADVQYEVKNASEATPASLTFTIRDNYPFITVGNRCFFADDLGWYWVDNTSLQHVNGSPTPHCFQVGIDKPEYTAINVPAFYTYTTPESDSNNGNELRMISKLAQSFTCPTYKLYIGQVNAYLKKYDSLIGRCRLRIVTNDSGKPSTTLAFEGAETKWYDFESLSNIGNWLNAPLLMNGWLNANTTYWLVLEGDSSYIANHTEWVKYIAWLCNNTDPYANGQAASYSGTTWTLSANDDAQFRIGIWQVGYFTEYIFCWFNETHGIESEPSEVILSSIAGATRIMFTSPDDEQVTHVKIYRSKWVSGTSFSNEVHTDEYYLVGTAELSDGYFVDVMGDSALGGELQTGGDLIAAKHLRLQDADGNLIVPYLLEIWNGRIWAVKFHDNVLNYSKMLEEAGATGVAGDSIYDYFPADNKWTLDSEIRSIRKRGEDEFEVYTSNNNVHVFRGGSDALNPPPDLTQQEMVIGANCFDDRTLQEHKGRHIFLTSDKEIKAFNGTVDLEELGDAISSFLLQNGTKFSSCIYKSQYCLGCDTDGDNVMDSVIIFDLSQPRITNWRRYQYLNSYGASGDLMRFYNLFVTRDARMFACPADLDTNDFYVVQLMTGYSDDWTTEYDDGVDITRIIQTQFIIPARRARWTRVELTAFYPHGMLFGTDFFGGGMFGGAETIPTYVIYAIGKSDEFCQTTIAPKSSRDISGHVAGTRLLSEECSVRIEDTGDKPDEIRSLTLHWSFN